MLSSIPPTKKYFIVMFLLSCFLLEVFTFVIYIQSKQNKNSNDWLIRSYELLRTSRLVLVDAIDMANSEQEYMVTGYESYLTAYKADLLDLNTHLAQLTNRANERDLDATSLASLLGAIEVLKSTAASHIGALHKGKITVYSIDADAKASKQAIEGVRSAFEVFSQNASLVLDHRAAQADKEENNYFWTLFIGGILDLGALVIANLVIFSLITKNSRAVDKLRKTEELFSIVLSGINDGIYDHNVLTGNIEYSNSYKAMLGYSEKELGNNQATFASLIHSEDLDHVKATFDDYASRQVPDYCCMFRLRHKDGRWVWVLSRGVGVWDENRTLVRIIGAHTDISIQKQREDELKFFMRENEVQRAELARAMELAEAGSRAKTDFLAAMSHEIRTPMNAVIGLTRLLLETPLGSKQHEMAATLQENANILLRLVNDLLDISRIEAGQVKLEAMPFQLEDVLKTTKNLFEKQAQDKGLELSIINSVAPTTLVGDAARIQQILINLVSNALKFTPAGSIKITCEASATSDRRLKLVVVVADTGVGIPSDQLPTIFDRFVQADGSIARRFGGSGLGLAISRSLANLMGGDITVMSAPDQGSKFTVQFIVEPALTAERMSISTTSEWRGERPREGSYNEPVLVVDDYPPNIMVATMMLEHLGYRHETATSGGQAIEIIKQRKTSFLAVLMDVQMQDLDGFETTRLIRTLEEQLKVRHYIIGVTAHALAGDRDRCLDAGMDEYMSKPIHPEILGHKLNELQEQPQMKNLAHGEATFS